VRSQALVLMLTSLLGVGCAADQEVEPVEMVVDGLRLNPVFTVQGVDHPAQPGPVRAASINSAGQYLFSFFPNPTSIHAFDPTGEYLSSHGREGQGPGEFGSAGPIVPWSSDSLMVYDPGNGRWTVFDQDWSPARSFPFMGDVATALVLDGENLLVSTPFANGQSPFYPLHVLSQEGEVRLSFGVETPETQPQRLDWIRRAIGPTTDGFWSAHRYGYVLERYDTEGTLQRTIRREVEWFPEVTELVGRLGPDQPAPDPFIVDVSEDAEGRLWILTVVPEGDWQAAFSAGRETPEGAQPDTDALYGSRLEILDAETGSLIASLYTDETFARILENGDIVGYSESASGVPVVTVWRPTLGAG
jgi:hypothetical protein